MNVAGAAPSLAELQSQFQDYLLRSIDRPPRLIVGVSGATVYAEAYLSRLAEALANDYPVLQALLGADDFDALAHRYALVHPSGHYSIRWFGRHLPAFLRTAAPFAEEPQLAELATVEWLLGEAFDASGATALDRSAMRRIPEAAWDRLTFCFHPSLRRTDLHFDVFGLWHALSRQGVCPAWLRNDVAQPWLVWRQGLNVRYRVMDAAEAIALDALRAGATLGTAAVKLVEESGMAASQVPSSLCGWLENWLRLALVTSARIVPCYPRKKQ
jgi:hypothetical protein